MIDVSSYKLAGPPPIADVRSLTHYGEPYDGNTRYFRSTLFVAAVRSCYDESCLLHGVEWMPPKVKFWELFIFFLSFFVHDSPVWMTNYLIGVNSPLLTIYIIARNFFIRMDFY